MIIHDRPVPERPLIAADRVDLQARRETLAMPAWSVGSREPCQASTEAVAEVYHGQQQSLRSPPQSAVMVGQLVGCRAAWVRLEQIIWALIRAALRTCLTRVVSR
jgi:hypothetical protein